MFDIKTTAIQRTAQPFTWPERVNGNFDVGPSDVRQSRLAAERALDEALAESFPASDPPSWTLGVVRPAPAGRVPADEERKEAVTQTIPFASAAVGALDIPRPPASERTIIAAMISVAAASGIVLLVPFVVLLVGTPIALLVRGIVHALTSLLGLVIR
jgi:hypothetical protein